MAEYNVLVRMQLSDIGVEAQLARIQAKIKPLSISVIAKATDVEKLNITLGKMDNQLQRLQIRNKDAFGNSQAVKDQLGWVENLRLGVEKGAVSVGKYGVAFGSLSNDVEAYNQEARTTINNTDNFGTSIIKVVGKIAMWGIATGILYGALRKLKEGVRYIEDLNKAMTNIGMVTGQTTAQLVPMAKQYNAMARELGVTTLNITEGATEWINFSSL